MKYTQVDTREGQVTLSGPAHVPGGIPSLPYNFAFPNASLYPLAALNTTGQIGRWLHKIADGAFTTLLCFPTWAYWQNPHCNYTAPYYSVVDEVVNKLMFSYKYLPDVDGHSYSGRYLSFLMSRSVPIKSTILAEWHDDRLMPWKHFVPMDMTMMDWFGIMEYFVGFRPSAGVDAERRKGHDGVAKDIALAGHDWSQKALRPEDMSLYMFRLILEYARICDDNREQLGWVEDLR